MIVSILKLTSLGVRSRVSCFFFCLFLTLVFQARNLAEFIPLPHLLEDQLVSVRSWTSHHSLTPVAVKSLPDPRIGTVDATGIGMYWTSWIGMGLGKIEAGSSCTRHCTMHIDLHLGGIGILNCTLVGTSCARWQH